MHDLDASTGTGTGTARPTADQETRVRARALASADEITEAVAAEYDAYLAVREGAAARSEPGGSVLAALAVLTPVVAATSAGCLLLLGYGLRLADPSGTLPESLLTAGWILALVAAFGALAALAALVRAALRERGEPRTARQAERVEGARLVWQRALLERGLPPHLRHYLEIERSGRFRAVDVHMDVHLDFQIEEEPLHREGRDPCSD